MKLREWKPEEIVWGDTRCEACIVPAAEVTFEDIPVCVDCADVLVDRAFGVDGMSADWIGTLPPIFEDRQNRSGRRFVPPADDDGRTIEDWRREHGIVVLAEPPAPAPAWLAEIEPEPPDDEGHLF